MPLEPCPFCGEAEKLEDMIVAPGAPAGWAIRCPTCFTVGPFAEHRGQAIANWNRRPTSTLTINGRPVAEVAAAIDAMPPSGRGETLDSTPGNHTVRYVGAMPDGQFADDVARAREKRELAGLPSVDTHADDTGLSMDFDLGGPPPKGKR